MVGNEEESGGLGGRISRSWEEKPRNTLELINLLVTGQLGGDAVYWNYKYKRSSRFEGQGVLSCGHIEFTIGHWNGCLGCIWKCRIGASYGEFLWVIFNSMYGEPENSEKIMGNGIRRCTEPWCLYGYVISHRQVSPSEELMIYLSYSSRDVMRIKWSHVGESHSGRIQEQRLFCTRK